MSFSQAYILPNNFRSEAAELHEDHCVAALPQLREQLAQRIASMYKAKQQSLLLVLQGMDASGKDGIIRRNFAKVNPQHFDVAAFKKPSPTELAHDFLWRIHLHCPALGRTTIFNRSHYEDMLVPGTFGTISEKALQGRLKSILEFEEHLDRNGTQILKFFLHISYERQGVKIAERQTNPKKQHKFKPSDITNRAHWDTFLLQYQTIFTACKGRLAWHYVSSDIKWQKDYIFLKLILEKLHKHFRCKG